MVSPTSGAFDGLSNEADALSARLELSPALGSEIAVSGYHGKYTPEFLGTDQSLTTWGVDGRQELAGFYLEGEFLYSRYAGLDDVLTHFASAAVRPRR